MNEGRDLAGQKRWEEARQVFEKAFSRAQNPRQAAQAAARTGEVLGEMGREREGIEYLQRSLELFHYDQVVDELKQMRVRLFSKTQSSGEIREALQDQLASRRGARVLPARPLMLKILFDYDSATLTSEGRNQVNQLGQALSQLDLSHNTVLITGHTDLSGTEDYNQGLSERRAANVAAEVVRQHGVPPDRINIEGRGKREPLYAGTSAQESSLNRRVEITIVPVNE